MKTTLFAIVIGAGIFCPTPTPAYPVYMPPGNIVQNPMFVDTWNHWSGSIQGALGLWSTMPNNNALVLTDVWQDLQTVPGQRYALDFYMAADLYFGPSVTMNVKIDGMTLQTVVTPPYVYDNQANRFEQVHWQEVTDLFTATGTTTRLEFVDVNTYDFLLASVSVVTIPEPATTSLLAGGFGAFAVFRRFHRRYTGVTRANRHAN
ncbi:MAG: PEP-CTERM sorting domain-containing protein [Verrucomicrobiota bacterium]